MKEELAKLVATERKNARDLKELRDLRAKMAKHVKPDVKILAAIDDEITKLTTGPS